MRIRHIAPALLFTAVALPGAVLSGSGLSPGLAMTPSASAACELDNPCGDVNDSGGVTSSDALSILKSAVGQAVTLQCDVIGKPAESSLLQTGQSKCYDTTGSEIPCSGTGQDAETKKGLSLAYTDNGDGTITDERTGLVWEKLDDNNVEGVAGIHDKDRKFTFDTAQEKAATFNTFSLGGRTDWRIPNIRELETIRNSGSSVPSVSTAFDLSCSPGCLVANCSCTSTATPHWSSTSSDKSPNEGWYLYFQDGQKGPLPKNTSLFVRAVAGPIFAMPLLDANAPRGVEECALVHPCGDVNESESVTSTDALLVLKLAVGQDIDTACPITGASSTALLLRTGQTECYESSGSVISCAGSGQDAEVLSGVSPSYSDNANGTVTDNRTGLIWEKFDDSNLEGIAGIHDKDNTYNLATGQSEKIATFNAFSFGGRSDWRIPNLRELESIVNYGESEPSVSGVFDSNCSPGCTIANCSCTGFASFALTSTTYDDLRSHQWNVWFKLGEAGVQSKFTTLHLRAVAGGN